MSSVVLIAAVACSAAVRVVMRRRHPLALVPLVIVCAVGFLDTDGSSWRWAFATCGAAIIGLAGWLAARSSPSADHR
jgi:hypothetical protein